MPNPRTPHAHAETPEAAPSSLPVDAAQPAPSGAAEQGRVLWVHAGHSANCSSVGSVVDYVMVAGTAGAALLAAVSAWLGREADARRGGGAAKDAGDGSAAAAPAQGDADADTDSNANARTEANRGA